MRQTRYQLNAQGETQENPKCKEISWTSRRYGPGGAEYKICQYCQLWTMYADNSVELKRKSEHSQESAAAACKVYVPYISDIV